MRIPLTIELQRAPGHGEVGLDSPREWFEFDDPEDGDHRIHADLTWLGSTWRCIFGAGCQGIVAERPDDGCCTHGAFFSGGADRKRVRDAAKRLTPELWQHHRSIERSFVSDDLEGRKRRRTATRAKGGCVFLNDADFPGGGGCALHALALAEGLHPMAYKPDVCWQLPIWWSQEVVRRPDGTEVLRSTLGEYDRRRWGSGGHDLDWWCTSAPAAHGSHRAVYQRYGAELEALLSPAAHQLLVEVLDARAAGRPLAPHPASIAAAEQGPAAAAHVRPVASA